MYQHNKNNMTLYYNGVQYEVETEDELEPINIVPEEVNDNNSEESKNFNQLDESYWTAKTTHLFLDECIKRKMFICDPKVRSYKVFFAIHKYMKARGYIFKVISLERKLQTMKRHLMLVRKNNENPQNKRTYWQYYDKMDTLFPICTDKESIPTSQPICTDKESIPTSQPAAETPQPPKSLKGIHQKSIPATGSSSTQESAVAELILNENSSALSSLTFDRKEKSTKTDCNAMELLKKQMLALEERRTVAIEKILIELRKSNKIKEELLDVNIEIFEAAKGLEEY